MNTTTKTISCITASLLMASSLFCLEESSLEDSALEESASYMESQEICQSGEICQSRESSEKRGQPCCPPLEPTCQPYVCKPEKCGNVQEPQTPHIPAYNAPAEINTGIMCDWNFFTSASFLYWQPLQDNMRIATQGSQSITTLLTPGALDHRKTIDMDFDFKPAFKVAMGMNFRNDDWVGYIEYTRLRGTDDVSASVSNTTPTLYNLWGDDPINTSLAGTAVFNSVNANFQCKLDFIDGMMERVYFVGQRLIFHSVFGLRFALIGESLQANYSYNGALLNNTSAKVIALPSSLTAVQRTNSWGIGPRMGLEMDWLLKAGVRLFGSGFADLLYTNYDIQTKSVTVPFTSFAPFVTGNAVTTTNKDDDAGALRTHVDLEIGLGWGRYMDYNNWHFDFSASYGFQAFFNQNMLVLPVSSPSNLYIQGLTFTARADY